MFGYCHGAMQVVHEPVAELIMANTPITVEDWDRPLFGTRIDHALIPRSGDRVSSVSFDYSTLQYPPFTPRTIFIRSTLYKVHFLLDDIPLKIGMNTSRPSPEYRKQI